MRRVTIALAAALAAACELQEVSIAEPEDLVVAEVLLYAGDPVQTALLHRTLGQDARVDGARIEVRSDTRGVLRYQPAPDGDCITDLDEPAAASLGSCYTVQAPPGFLAPGERYALRIDLADGRVLTGTTVVPGAFEVVRPSELVCALRPDRPFELVWRRAEHAWVYVIETNLLGIGAALRARGIAIDQGSLRLLGLSISAADTTIVFPSELGIFDRFDTDLADVLLALQRGLPPGVDADVLVGAADRNYVNWARGGRFNPSGLIRVPSVSGDGTGMFGAIVPRRLRLATVAGALLPPC
jgi:hypothetical protein